MHQDTASSSRVGFVGSLTVLALTAAVSSVSARGLSEPPTARYRVTFVSTWSETTHPSPHFPTFPHFSGLIGATHGDDVSFWGRGGFATPGIKDMAELGAKDALRQEVLAAIAERTAGAVISGPGIGLSPGMASVEFDVKRRFSRVTLVSMVAPSPDWFVGVSGLELRPDDRWVDLLVVKLRAYDAGTDSGRRYTSPNRPTRRPTKIRRIRERPFLIKGRVPPVGAFIFERID